MSQASRAPVVRILLLLSLLLLGLPCLGGLGNVAYLRARQAGALARWQPLGTPPQPALAIVSADLDAVYVRAADETLYGCGHQRRTASPVCWSAVAAPPAVDSDVRLDEPFFSGQPPNPPGPVRDTLTVTVFFAEDTFEARYAVLDDGSVWMWEYDAGSYLALAVLCAGPLLGLALGGLAAALFLGFWGLRRLWRPGPA